MSKLTPRERATMIKRVKEINAKIQEVRLTMEQRDQLHKERALLTTKLLEDRQGQ